METPGSLDGTRDLLCASGCIGAAAELAARSSTTSHPALFWRCSISPRPDEVSPRLRVFPNGETRRSRAKDAEHHPGNAHSNRRYHKLRGVVSMRRGPAIAKAA